MARINLLPWREELRQQKKKNFLTATGVFAVLTLIAFGFIHVYIQGLQEYHTARNKILEDEIVILDKKLGEIKNIEETKNKLLAKIDLIQKLQESRPEVVHLIDEIPKNTPDGVFLTKFTQTGQELAFEGKSQSNARVSAFMRSIDTSSWLNSPVLEEIKAEGVQSTQSNFTLKATLGKPAVEATKVDATNK
ncbi:pilus assembly protein PilN [Crenothrix sp. D3]|nr:pilus assembly protein PilN [Crenothrix sp. D3]